MNTSALTGVPPHLRLPVAVTGFWMREASSAPSLPQLQALLLGMIHGEVARNNQPGGMHVTHSMCTFVKVGVGVFIQMHSGNQTHFQYFSLEMQDKTNYHWS